jgi:hypothetical protein
MIEAERSGCIVVIEPGARWPAPAFERLADREGVVLVARLPDEPLLCFLTRLAHGCTLLERNGISIRSAILSCCGAPGAGPETRALVIRSLAQRLARDRESHVTLVGDRGEGATPTELVALVDKLVVATSSAPITVDVLSQNSLPGQARADVLVPQSSPVRLRRPKATVAPLARTA